MIWRTPKSAYFFVPPLLENIAFAELSAYRSENRRVYNPKQKHPVYKNAWMAGFFLTPLLLFYPLQHDSRFFSFLPSPEELIKLGALNYNACVFQGQWNRLATALSLHTDISHLFGNLFFGAIFLFLLARLTGCGRAFFLCVCAAALANFCAVIFREPGYASVGFSTAVFAALGLTAGIMIRRLSDQRKRFLSLAASLALLSLLGTEGVKTDYGAHIAGLICGIFIGFLAGDRAPKFPQCVYGIAGLGFLTLPWLFALF